MSVTTALPSPASVGARITPRINASLSENEPNRARATSAPSTIVSGRPMPSRRTGREASRRRALRLMREESENSTTASVASASLRTVELVGPRVRSSSTSGPTRTPTATTTIAGVIGVLASRRETAARSSSVSPTVARPQSTASRYSAGQPIAQVSRRRGSSSTCGRCRRCRGRCGGAWRPRRRRCARSATARGPARAART